MTVLAQKRDAVRSELAKIAIELFARSGFDEVTVEEIARAAGISSRTFFRYFSGKDEIVLDFLSKLQQRLIATLDARPPGEGAVEALRNAYDATSKVERGERQRWLQIGRIMTSSPALVEASFGWALAHAEPLVERVAARMGVDPSGPQPRAVVAAMSAVATTEWNAWVEDGRGEPNARIVAALALLERGLSEMRPAEKERSK